MCEKDWKKSLSKISDLGSGITARENITCYMCFSNGWQVISRLAGLWEQCTVAISPVKFQSVSVFSHTPSCCKIPCFQVPQHKTLTIQVWMNLLFLHVCTVPFPLLSLSLSFHTFFLICCNFAISVFNTAETASKNNHAKYFYQEFLVPLCCSM